MSRTATPWRWFAAYAIAGACFGLAVTAVGVFTVPAGVLLVLWLARRRMGGEVLGVVAGIGVVVVTIGIVNLDYRPCSNSQTSAVLPVGGPREISYSCGGVDGLPWIIVGSAVLAIAALVYTRLRRVPPRDIAGPV